MEHNVSKHNSIINKLCRICLGRALTKADEDSRKRPILCAKYKGDVHMYYGLDIAQDTDCHSKSICKQCLRRITNLKYQTRTYSSFEAAWKTTNKCQNIWCVYESEKSSDECSLCSHYISQYRGGRPRYLRKWRCKKKTVQTTQSDEQSSNIPDIGVKAGLRMMHEQSAPLGKDETPPRKDESEEMSTTGPCVYMDRDSSSIETSTAPYVYIDRDSSSPSPLASGSSLSQSISGTADTSDAEIKQEPVDYPSLSAQVDTAQDDHRQEDLNSSPQLDVLEVKTESAGFSEATAHPIMGHDLSDLTELSVLQDPEIKQESLDDQLVTPQVCSPNHGHRQEELWSRCRLDVSGMRTEPMDFPQRTAQPVMGHDLLNTNRNSSQPGDRSVYHDLDLNTSQRNRAHSRLQTNTLQQGNRSVRNNCSKMSSPLYRHSNIGQDFSDMNGLIHEGRRIIGQSHGTVLPTSDEGIGRLNVKKEERESVDKAREPQYEVKEEAVWSTEASAGESHTISSEPLRPQSLSRTKLTNGDFIDTSASTQTEELRNILNKPLNAPLSPQEVELLTHLVRRKLHQSKDHRTIHLETTSVSMVLQKVL